MSGFVGVRNVQSAEELRSLIQEHQSEKSCFFLRWPHKVSGFRKALPDEFPSPDGQMFDSDIELRWKQQGQSYSVLLLSIGKIYADFESVGDQWEVKDQDAHLYSKTETRFPKGIDDQDIQIGQRFFTDLQTSTIHFVALKLN